MMGAEGFGSESFNDAGELVSQALEQSMPLLLSSAITTLAMGCFLSHCAQVVGNSGGSNTPGAGLSSQGFLKRFVALPLHVCFIAVSAHDLLAC